MFDKLKGVEDRFQELERLLSDPKVVQDRDAYQKYIREHAEVAPVVAAFRQYKQVDRELDDSLDLLNDDDPEMKQMAAEEVDRLEKDKHRLQEELKILLVPKDPLDEKNVILEIRAGTGGDEAGLFAGDLFKMYQRYADARRWKVEVMDHHTTGVGGLKEITASVNGKGAYSRLKFESGTHRVQRVPETESQGRIHTSACTVAILPEVEGVEEIDINPADIRVDTFRASGAGGQHVNKTSSAVRITHIPTNIAVQCQNERSQHRNKEMAMKVLKARLYEIEEKKMADERAKLESDKKDISWGSQIRSYVLQPYRLIKDHRTEHETGNVDAVLDGSIDPFIKAYLLWGK